MSGRGKGGKGLGAASKKQKTAREAEAEAYQWKDGEGAVIITYANGQDNEIQVYCLPQERVHPLLKPSVKECNSSQIYIQLSSDDNENSDVFDHLTPKDITKWQNGEEGGEEEDDDDEEEEGEEQVISDQEKEDVLDTISTWVATLGPWQKNPSAAVTIACRLSVWESE